MAQCLVTIGRPDLCHSVSSLNRFGSCPREGHLRLALRMFGYLKKYPDRRLVYHSSDIQFLDLKDPRSTQVWASMARQAAAELLSPYNAWSTIITLITTKLRTYQQGQ